MDDYIKRSEVLKTLKQLLYETAINNVECNPSFSEACEEIAANRIEGYLSAVPAADVRENVRGKWIHTDASPHKVYCSVCFGTYLHNEKWAAELPITLHPNFCPNCGADMRGEKEAIIDE